MKAKLSLIICTFFLGTLVFSQSSPKQAQTTYNEIGSILPKIEALTVDSTLITNADLTSKHPVILIIFNPSCGHCIHAGKIIAENAKKFKHNKVLFYTYPLNHSKIKRYMQETGLGEYDYFMTGADQSRATVKISTPGTLPQVNIYKDGKLIKILHSGSSIVEDLAPYLGKKQSK